MFLWKLGIQRFVSLGVRLAQEASKQASQRSFERPTNTPFLVCFGSATGAHSFVRLNEVLDYGVRRDDDSFIQPVSQSVGRFAEFAVLFDSKTIQMWPSL